jgi:two-component system, cell cycle response regulator
VPGQGPGMEPHGVNGSSKEKRGNLSLPTTMETIPPSSEPSPDFDPATLIATGTGDWAQPDQEEWALIRYVGSPIGEVIRLHGPDFWIGRTVDNDISLAEPEVSRKHALLRQVSAPDGGVRVEIEDERSTNGTFINGKRLPPDCGPVHLRQGDVVRVGGHAFKLKRLDALERNYHQAVLTQATVDQLTGLNNRATVLGYLEKHFELARRYKRPLSVVLCDLDHFKQINDTFGHPAGDQVLQRFGALLIGRLRGSDQAGRIGGEEFLVVLPETQSHEARNVAEDLRKSIQAESLTSSDGRELKVTCSLGVAQIHDGDSDGGALLARADVALYRAKGAGRNRVEYIAAR